MGVDYLHIFMSIQDPLISLSVIIYGVQRFVNISKLYITLVIIITMFTSGSDVLILILLINTTLEECCIFYCCLSIELNLISLMRDIRYINLV